LTDPRLVVRRIALVPVQLKDFMFDQAPWALIGGRKTFFVSADVHWRVVTARTNNRLLVSVASHLVGGYDVPIEG
jgi:hypothetical protein